jgi:hypothetical protein
MLTAVLKAVKDVVTRTQEPCVAVPQRPATHRLISVKHKNFIPKLMDGDQVVSSQEGKQDIMFDYFNNLLGTALPRVSTLDLPFFLGPSFLP